MSMTFSVWFSVWFWVWFWFWFWFSDRDSDLDSGGVIAFNEFSTTLDVFKYEEPTDKCLALFPATTGITVAAWTYIYIYLTKNFYK